MHNDTFIIARAGWFPLGIAVTVFVLATLFGFNFIQFLSLAAAAAIGWIFRNPERIVPYFQNDSIVSNVDGTILSIDNVDGCDLCDEPCYKIVISSALFDTSILRAPFESEVEAVTVRRGARLNASHNLAGELNEQVAVKFTASPKKRMYAEHLLETVSTDIAVTAQPEQKIAQGSRYGTLLKGVTTLYLPVNCRINLHPGDKVRAGETLLGYFSTADER